MRIYLITSVLGGGYDDYVKLCDVPHIRSKAIYDALINDLDTNTYDIRKGAIVVDQDRLILDGQHRSCILLNRYGWNHYVDVVQMYYKRNRSIKFRLLYRVLLLSAKIKAYAMMLFHK